MLGYAFQGLSNLVRLEELTLDHNQLTSLEGLGKCTGLTELSLRSNRVTDLAGLAPLTRLDVLRLEENGVEGLDSMPTLPDLTVRAIGSPPKRLLLTLVKIETRYRIKKVYGGRRSATSF